MSRVLNHLGSSALNRWMRWTFKTRTGASFINPVNWGLNLPAVRCGPMTYQRRLNVGFPIRRSNTARCDPKWPPP